MKKYIPYLVCLFFIATLQSQTVELNLFANGFNSPVDLQNAGDERLFVVEQGGRIKILNPDGTTNPTLFLDISILVSNGSEQGLLGLAFHPNYANNGYFYVNYTKTNGDTRIARYSVDPADPDIALSGSELTIIDYEQPFSNHNGGGIAFGPDGYLYIASGDGGSGGDPGNRAQNTTLLLGKLLRLDVDNPEAPNNYGIPADNPFEGSINDAEEIWAYGLRNPWRFSFDSLNGDIWIGDVGQGDVEEIDHAGLTEAGLNYGWRCYEGSVPYNTAGCPDPGLLTFPVTEYSSGTGSGNCSVTGGRVNRSPDWPDEYGIYYFADVCSGRIFTYDLATDNLINHGSFNGSWVSFGVDSNEQMYIVDIGGSIYKVDGTTVIIGTTDFDEASIVMFPNPATDNVTFSTAEDKIISIEIMDLKGSVLYSENNSNTSEKNISTSGYSPGIYLVKVTTESGALSIKKLVIN
ncbi:putative secreted protein (Por secretion system target) [Ulvibacter sp. MAR_2010_11]|uniref:PQQ-dependent sugar dehydrogenase n=1 Tax=Ulvibacter sp. MAR_2010_11 TaxID=1250229 RepID=UPI000C2C2677|nr:PQQ-dependent sugar dehydrogenase [Ulvibacter sp. MAR_2010_11]PKA81910.1 putative secreted protein (Por secretion system target) [Ulvibacter sp. MAR_2010_11]